MQTVDRGLSLSANCRMTHGSREAMTQFDFLTVEQLSAALDVFPSDQIVSVVRIRYMNRQEIRTREDFRVEQLRAFLESCVSGGHQPGGDLELEIPALGKTLVGHHDGLYWLEPTREGDG